MWAQVPGLDHPEYLDIEIVSSLGGKGRTVGADSTDPTPRRTPGEDGRRDRDALVLAPLAVEHWPAVEEIYRAGIATGQATFESEPPTWEQFDRAKLPAHRLVALDGDGVVLGWAAVSPTSTRRVYAGVVEHSLYVHPAAQGRGVTLSSTR